MLLLFFVGLALILLVCLPVWPGFLSYDPLHVLFQARYGLSDNIQPAICTYVQYLCDRIYRGPGLLFLLQDASYIMGCATILYLADLPAATGALLLCALVLNPGMLGLLLVVWKDVGSMGFLTAAFACIFLAEQRCRKWPIIPGATFLFLGIGFRLNAIAAAPAFVAFLLQAWRSCQTTGRASGSQPVDARPNDGDRCKQHRTTMFIQTMAISAALWAVLTAMNTFRLPDMRRLDGHLLTVMQLFDLIGISHYSGENVVPSELALVPNFTADTIGYYPQNVEYSFDKVGSERGYQPLARDGLLTLEQTGRWTNGKGQTLTSDEVSKSWANAISLHPGAYLKHRLSVAAAFLGLTGDGVHYPTHPRIDSNDLGVSVQLTPLATLMLGWVLNGTRLFVFRPCVIYLASVLLLSYLLSKRPRSWHRPAVLLGSSLSMLLVQLPVTVAADYRYHAWGLAATLLAYSVLFVPKLRRRKAVE